MEARTKISFTVLVDNAEIAIDTYSYEYDSLMELLRDKIYLDNFGECGGMGRCATCLITIETEGDALPSLARNEQNTLEKLGLLHAHYRLSCQIMITDALHQKRLKIEDPNLIL